MSSVIRKVHKQTVLLQNQTNTLNHLITTHIIPLNAQTINLSSKSIKEPALQKLGQHQDRVLLKFNESNYYYGYIRQNQATDTKAVYIFKDGTYYRGAIVDGAFHGKGKLQQMSLDFMETVFQYQGEWKNGKPHGQGKEIIYNSSTYEGQFLNGKKSGKGTMTYKDGTVYEGQFKDNEITGKGVYTTKAHKWAGTWKEGYLQGEGEQVSFGQEDQEADSIAGNSVYKGGFTRGQKNGFGTYTWGNDFSQYDGHFSNGQLDGQGRIKIGQAEYIGLWKKGVELQLDTASRIQFKRVSNPNLNTKKSKSLTINIP